MQQSRVDYEALSFKSLADSFAIETKVRVLVEKRPDGGVAYRCPPGTPGGGNFTDRTGRSCAIGMGRRGLRAFIRGAQRLDDHLGERADRRAARPNVRQRVAGQVRGGARALNRAADRIEMGSRRREREPGAIRRRLGNAAGAAASNLEASRRPGRVRRAVGNAAGGAASNLERTRRPGRVRRAVGNAAGGAASRIEEREPGRVRRRLGNAAGAAASNLEGVQRVPAGSVRIQPKNQDDLLPQPRATVRKPKPQAPAKRTPAGRAAEAVSERAGTRARAKAPKRVGNTFANANLDHDGKRRLMGQVGGIRRTIDGRLKKQMQRAGLDGNDYERLRAIARRARWSNADKIEEDLLHREILAGVTWNKIDELDKLPASSPIRKRLEAWLAKREVEKNKVPSQKPEPKNESSSRDLWGAPKPGRAPKPRRRFPTQPPKKTPPSAKLDRFDRNSTAQKLLLRKLLQRGEDSRGPKNQRAVDSLVGKLQQWAINHGDDADANFMGRMISAGLALEDEGVAENFIDLLDKIHANDPDALRNIYLGVRKDGLELPSAFRSAKSPRLDESKKSKLGKRERDRKKVLLEILDGLDDDGNPNRAAEAVIRILDNQGGAPGDPGGMGIDWYKGQIEKLDNDGINKLFDEYIKFDPEGGKKPKRNTTKPPKKNRRPIGFVADPGNPMEFIPEIKKHFARKLWGVKDSELQRWARHFDAEGHMKLDFQVKVGENGIKSKLEAEEFLRNGGDLDLVPDILLADAITELGDFGASPSARFHLSRAGGINGGNGGPTDSVHVIDTVSGRRFLLKAGVYGDKETLNELAGAAIMHDLGIPIAPIRLAGVENQWGNAGRGAFGNRGADTYVPILIENYGNWREFLPGGNAGHRFNQDSVIRLAFADYIMGNTDRHGGNWDEEIHDGQPVAFPFDQGLGFAGRGRQAPKGFASYIAREWQAQGLLGKIDKDAAAEAIALEVLERARELDIDRLVQQLEIINPHTGTEANKYIKQEIEGRLREVIDHLRALSQNDVLEALKLR